MTQPDNTNQKNTSSKNTQADSDNAEEQLLDFSTRYDSALPQLLSYLNIGLVLTSYQAGRVITVRSHNGEDIDTHFMTCPRPMGLAIDKHRMTLGIWAQVLDFRRDDSICERVDEQGRVDACYVPRASHVTGMINIHDIAWGTEGLWAVNSTFSCLSTLDANYSFVPRWQPPWITELAPEDRCHLNGMAMLDGRPKYVTTFNKADRKGGWRDDQAQGTLIDVDTNEVLIEGLNLPHSPRAYRNKIYVCESAYGLIWQIDGKTGERQLFAKLQGFTRGMVFYQNLMFVGLSKVRESENQPPLPLMSEFNETFSGVWVLDINSGDVVTFLTFDGDINQVYDVAVVPECRFPQIVEWQDSFIESFYHYPHD